MSKYRFKTREEFIQDGLWNDKYNCPDEWASEGQMNKYLGIDVPEKFNMDCDEKEDFEYDGWYFRRNDYVLKEQQEYFDDLSQHIGRYIRALIDNPHSGSLVYKGDVGKIINTYQVDFPNRKGYNCTSALDKNNLGVKYELLPEDYSPEQEDVPERISFYVKYTKEFTEDLYNALWEWSKKNSEFSPRGFGDSYGELKQHKFYIFDNWTLNCHGKYGGTSPYKFSYGVDNNKQSCEKEYSIEQVKKLIGYKESNIEFIPGKWYKYNGWYIKYKDHVDDIWRSSEQINYSKKYNKIESRFGGRDSDDKKILLIDLSEIQEYLPDGHPDKIIKQKFEIGKWYKWYQKNHGNYHFGKVERINTETNTVVMLPWIVRCDSYNYSGYFDLSKAEQIQEISVEEIQEFLPNSHPDKITSNEFKKGEYIVITDKFDSWSKDFISNHIYKQRKDSTYLYPEYDSLNSITNGWAKYTKKNSHNWRYATQEEIDEYERRGKPYDVTELQKKELSMEEIQEECKKRFPIGCTYISTNKQTKILKDDSCTYIIIGKQIWAHSGGGCLYDNEKWAELVSLPEENITEIPEYVECFIPYGKAIPKKVYKTTDENESNKLFGLSWKQVLIDFGRLEDGSFKISNKEAYEKQKSHIPEYIECTERKEYYFIKGNIYKVIDSSNLSSARLVSNIDFCDLKAGTPLFCSMEVDGKKYWKPSTKEKYEEQKSLTYESVSGCFPTDKSMFIFDEVGQYPLTPSECWKKIPKFTEQNFDIYGPTPDIE